MKPWNKINRSVLQAYRTIKLKITNNFWRGEEDQAPTIQAEKTADLMNWDDDGGQAPGNHPDSKDKLK
jgi:hypothetical protein